jgi:hypothetical protein
MVDELCQAKDDVTIIDRVLAQHDSAPNESLRALIPDKLEVHGRWPLNPRGRPASSGTKSLVSDEEGGKYRR